MEFVVASARHNEVPAQADLVVTHGGHGTVIKTELEELEDVGP
jgi:UDP:flavonoid glycosyltransferase YjiC (YdhE family)